MPNQDGPGGSSNSVFATENQVPISANGQRVEANNFQLDGVTAMSQAWGGAAVVTPNQESVKEIRVSSSSYSAEFGRNTGAQIQVVSQNGTNLFHGSAVFKRSTPGLNTEQQWGGPHGETPQRVNQRLSQTAASIGARSSGTTCSSSLPTRASRVTARALAPSGSRRRSSSPRFRRSARTASRRGRSRCQA